MSQNLSEKIQLGSSFKSFADFDEAFKAWCTELDYSFRIGSSETMKGQRDKKERLRYRYAVYNCIHYGEPRIRGTGIRPHQTYLSTGCGACLRLTYQPDEDCLKIIRIADEHSGHGKASEEMQKRMRAKVEGSDEPKQIRTPPPQEANIGRTRSAAAAAIDDAETPKTARLVSDRHPNGRDHSVTMEENMEKMSIIGKGNAKVQNRPEAKKRQVAAPDLSVGTGKAEVDDDSADQPLSSGKRRVEAIDYRDQTLNIKKIYKKQRKLVKKLEKKTEYMEQVVNKRREKDGRPTLNPPPITNETLQLFSQLRKTKTLTVEQEAEMNRLSKSMVVKKCAAAKKDSPPESDNRNIEDEEEWITVPE